MSGTNVIAFFEQAFETPAFRDRGRKLLAFASGKHGMQIVREELLSSHVEGGGTSCCCRQRLRRFPVKLCT